MRIKHLRFKFILFISLLTIGIISILGTITVASFSNALLKEVRTIADQKMHIISSDLEEELKYVFNLGEIIKNNEELQSLILIKTSNDEELYEKMREVSNITRGYAYADVAINSIFVMDNNNQILDPFYMISPYKEIIEKYDSYDTFIEDKAYSAFSKPSNFPSKLESDPGEKSTITYFETYLSKEDYRPLGTILINVKIEYLFHKFKNACNSEFDMAYIIDNQGNIIYQVNEESVEGQAKRDIHPIAHAKGAYPLTIMDIVKTEGSTGIINVSDKDYYFIKNNLEVYPNWQVVGVMEYNTLKTSLNNLLKYFYAIAGISILIILSASILFSDRITKPIISLKKSMDQLALGEWPEPLKATTHDEIKVLIEGYNNMLEEQQKLIQQIYHEQEEKNKKEVETVQLRLDLLQSQINPHFIHNTLHTMQYLLKANKTEGLYEMLVSFNRLLRYNMSIDRDFITIEEECLCIENFTNILKYRYGQAFDISYSIPSQVKQYYIPKLILQPLVENAIYHGIIPKGYEASVHISVLPYDSKLMVKVEDTGVGMSDEKVNRILQTKLQGSSSSFNQIGIHNIDKRLKLLYGEEAGLKIISKEQMGTTVSFTIPIKMLTNEESQTFF